jgi:hypothetical protein
MLHIDPKTQKQIDAVKAQCKELEEAFDACTGLLDDFETMLNHCARYRDPNLKQLSHNTLTPLYEAWDSEEDLQPLDCCFWLEVRKPEAIRPHLAFAINFHRGVGFPRFFKEPEDSSPSASRKPYWTYG